MDADIKHIHEDIEVLKQDMALIKHIITQEGKLSKEARERLHLARETPDSEYKEL